jgi:hypothetical protein
MVNGFEVFVEQIPSLLDTAIRRNLGRSFQEDKDLPEDLHILASCPDFQGPQKLGQTYQISGVQNTESNALSSFPGHVHSIVPVSPFQKDVAVSTEVTDRSDVENQ